jgi:hypothetical protein
MIMMELANWQNLDCNPDPQWSATVCGFYLADSNVPLREEQDGCVPIDGCGSW